MKKVLAILMVASILVCSVVAASADSVIDTILSAGTTQAFTDKAVSEDDLNKIMEAGLSATSAINQQPWYFVAVTNSDVMSQLSGGGFSMPASGAPGGEMPANAPAGAPNGTMPANAPSGAPEGAAPAMPASSGAKAAMGDSPAAIIIYMDSATKSPNASFDCGLAAQNMYIAAVSLGYGVKIVSSPTRTLNGDQHDAICAQLGVDTSYQAVAVLLIGTIDTDATSSASTRNALSEKTTIIK